MIRMHKYLHQLALIGDDFFTLQDDGTNIASLIAQSLFHRLSQHGIRVLIGGQHKLIEGTIAAITDQFNGRIASNEDRQLGFHDWLLFQKTPGFFRRSQVSDIAYI